MLIDYTIVGADIIRPHGTMLRIRRESDEFGKFYCRAADSRPYNITFERVDKQKFDGLSTVCLPDFLFEFRPVL